MAVINNEEKHHAPALLSADHIRSRSVIGMAQAPSLIRSPKRAVGGTVETTFQESSGDVEVVV